MRILHTGDLHIGMQFLSYPQLHSILSEERINLLKKIVDLGNKTNCNLIVISGDLFDRLSVKESSIIEVASILKGFEGNMIAVLPGNHDYIASSDTRLWKLFKENMPSNTILLEEKRYYSLEDYNLEAGIFAYPCTKKQSKSSSIERFDIQLENNILKIGVAHITIIELCPQDKTNEYYPTSLSQLKESNIDLWLLGHIHTPYYDPSYPYIFYSGTPEPDGFDCEHEGYVWIIDIDKEKKIKTKKERVGKYRFVKKESKISNIDELEWLLKELLENAAPNLILKLIIKGYIKKEERTYLKELEEKLREKVLYLEIDDSELRSRVTFSDISKEFEKGSFPYILLDRLKDDEYAFQKAYELLKDLSKENAP